MCTLCRLEDYSSI
uniref:Uncharacterized protein n=1 Tax=Anguilla anguilla TaxID=7936 RepID=A0A0E9XVV2_ANGAN